jgi:very-short-patch-repair endonuclease
VAAGKGAYLSCLGAAFHRDLPVAAGTAIHVAVPADRVVISDCGLEAHRNALEAAPSAYRGLPAVTVETALVQSFACISDRYLRRALVIESVRERLVSATRVATAIPAGASRRPELLDLLTLCARSQSEAEIVMLLLIRQAGLPEPERQYAVAGHRYRLDLAYPHSLLAIEVDGKAWHFNAERRTADIRRDAELAAEGWLTVRFTYEQMSSDPSWVARCIRSALASRGTTKIA